MFTFVPYEQTKVILIVKSINHKIVPYEQTKDLRWND